VATAERESRENESCGADARAASKQILFTSSGVSRDVGPQGPPSSVTSETSYVIQRV
jgi:hypothetical protein